MDVDSNAIVYFSLAYLGEYRSECITCGELLQISNSQRVNMRPAIIMNSLRIILCVFPVHN
jgi:hypothetical protein